MQEQATISNGPDPLDSQSYPFPIVLDPIFAPGGKKIKGLRNDDMILIDRCQRGDRYAIDELLGRYRQAAFLYALKITRHAEEAYDVVSEGFLRIHRGIGKFKGSSSFSTWMFRILKNCFLDRRRKQRIEPVMSLDQPAEHGEGELLLQAEDDSPSPFDMCAQTESFEELRQIIKKLKPRDRMLLQLYYDNELTYQQIAMHFGIPEGTVKSRLNRARTNLKRLVDGDSSMSDALLF